MVDSSTDRRLEPSNEASLTARDSQQHRDNVRQQKAKGLGRFFEPNLNVNRSARLFAPHYENPWDEEKAGDQQPRWIDSVGGRMAIRGFSRGVLGAGFMTVGDHLVEEFVPRSATRGWTPEHRKQLFTRADGAINHRGYYLNEAMNGLAKSYDVTFGKLFKAAFGEGAVTFRSHRNFHPLNDGSVRNRPLREHHPLRVRGVSHIGRTYGEEAVAITLNFAMGSIGDAWGRNIAGLFDHNVKHSWLHDGRIDWRDLAKSTFKSGVHILSYNQMEDWFAAVPYVYQMRAQRHLLDKVWGGSKLMLEHSQNGGAYQVARPEGPHNGNYLLPGAIDLHLRFMGYNNFTLIFRDAFHHVQHMLSHWHDPEKTRNERGLVEESIKYLLKSVIKANIYMAPAVAFFWPQRVAHSMNSDNVIIPGQGAAASELLPKTGLFQGIVTPQVDAGWFERSMAALGNTTRRVGTGLGERIIALRGIENEAAQKSVIKYSRSFVGNSAAYTPYMIAKYETANWWDTPQMDAAIYRFIDGLDHLKPKEMKRGLADIGNVMRRLPVSQETELRTHEPRGLVNSTQQGLDSENMRDGHIVKSFADLQREHRLARQKDTNERAPVTTKITQGPRPANENAPEAANSNAVPGSRVSGSEVMGNLALSPQHSPV